MQWFSSLELFVKTEKKVPQNRAQNMIANLISNKLVPTQWTLNKNPKNKNLKSNSTKIDMWRHKSSKHDRIMVLSTQTCQSVCVCVCVRARASNSKVCKLGQSVKTHIHMLFQDQRNMIIPTTFVFHRIQRDAQKHL